MTARVPVDRTVEMSRLWDRVWRRRGAIAAIVGVIVVATAIVAFVLPPWYQGQASLLPPSEEESGFGLSSLLRGIGVPGVKVPTQAAPADVFLAILESRRLNEEVVNRFDLKRRYRVRFMADAVKQLRRHARFELTEAGTIQIRVEDRDPRRAAEMTNAYVDLLDRFNRELRMTKGRRTREFVGRRLLETRQELETAEQRLADYQTRHKTVALTREMSTATEAAARLYAQRTVLQVRLGVIRSYSMGQSDEELQIRQQLAQIDRQLNALPETGLDLARLIRDVKTLEQVYVLLTAQHEEARITEARDVPTVEKLDVATPPERKSRPRRGVMILVAAVLGAAAAVTWALLDRGGPRETIALVRESG